MTSTLTAKKLSGKVALVTGGSRGIGAAIANALADDGADVAISYAASADKAAAVVKELLAKGVRAHAFKADQADAQQVAGLVNAVVDRFGKLDILVNNAGVFANAPVDVRTNNLDELERLFAVNVGGVAAAVRTAAPLMGFRRSHHFDRLRRRRHFAVAWCCRLFGHEGCGCRLHPRLGARPWAEGHHRQYRPARSNRHRYGRQRRESLPTASKPEPRSVVTARRRRSQRPCRSWPAPTQPTSPARRSMWTVASTLKSNSVNRRTW